MDFLKKRILEGATFIPPDIIKVDMFLNHLIDVDLLNEIGREFCDRFSDKMEKINKILTIEASGIGISCIAAQYFSVPVLFAKKGQNKNVGQNTYSASVFSFTKNKSFEVFVSKNYLGPEDHVLIIDDFLANGEAVRGLMSIVDQAGATLEGVGIVIEKGFQDGGAKLRSEGVRIESLALIKGIEDGKPIFADM
ncbi:MAG: xanthine phosphoribosyltransferase [Clostridiales bacterium]|nr:xanthine phosphoribosyltransferase [Clostridiales bacterium]